MLNMTNSTSNSTSTLDSRTAEEKQMDAELATMVALETKRQLTRRASLESEHCDAIYNRDLPLARAIRSELNQVDRALMALSAGRLP